MDIERQKRIELARLEAIFKALEDPNSDLCRWLETYQKEEGSREQTA
jgi:hypothetical protein